MQQRAKLLQTFQEMFPQKIIYNTSVMYLIECYRFDT